MRTIAVALLVALTFTGLLFGSCQLIQHESRLAGDEAEDERRLTALQAENQSLRIELHLTEQRVRLLELSQDSAPSLINAPLGDFPPFYGRPPGPSRPSHP